MTDDLAVEIIRIRHRLRALAVGGGAQAEAAPALARFQALCEALGDPELRFEHARWRARLGGLGSGRVEPASA